MERRLKRENLTVVRHEFTGVMNLSVYGSLIIELIKHVLYMRMQIPVPYKTLKQQVQISKDGAPPAKTRRNSENIRKFLQDTDRIFSTIDQIFCNNIGNDVQQVMLMLGSTFVSPKEIYRFSFENHSRSSKENSNSLTLNWCMRNIFKTLMSSEFNGKMIANNLAVNNVFVFVLCPTSSNRILIDEERLMPKFNFDPKSRGLDFDIRLSCAGVSEESAGAGSSNCCSGGDADCDLEWFQVVPRIKGFRL